MVAKRQTEPARDKGAVPAEDKNSRTVITGKGYCHKKTKDASLKNKTAE